MIDQYKFTGISRQFYIFFLSQVCQPKTNKFLYGFSFLSGGVDDKIC